MLTQLYWANCTLARSEAEPIDSFWLEATKEEAHNLVYPYCSAETIIQSKTFGESQLPFLSARGAVKLNEEVTTIINPLLKYCFLVAQDLSTIKAFPVYYPYSPMWQIHSPFQGITTQKISDLQKLKEIKAIALSTKAQLLT